MGLLAGEVMAEATLLKYRAFLSYTHADIKVAARLHKRLEAFSIDKDLVGRGTALGPIPKSLRPIFRDREDWAAGHTITELTLAALDASSALVVLCSPSSARSRYVNEEVRLFKSRHPERLVIPVIVDGIPGDAERECFAPAVRFLVEANGAITSTPAEVLAADVREEGDGLEMATAKVVAGLIGLSTDEVFRRAERDRRRRVRLRNGVIAVLALLTLAATGGAAYAWHLLKTNEAFLADTLTLATKLVSTAVENAEEYRMPRTVTLELLAQAEGYFEIMARLGQPTPELRYQKAWMLIQFAHNYAIVGDTSKQLARALAAQSLLAGLTREKPDDRTYQRNLALADDQVGEVLAAQGKLDEALKNYRDGLGIRERLAASD